MSNYYRTTRSSCCPAVLTLLAGCLLAHAGRGTELTPESNAPPAIPAAPAPEPTPGLRVQPGFRVELVATDPAITSPVAMAFDENGRLFVVERPEASPGNGTNGNAGRIRLLEDTEGAGEFNTSTLFATNLPWASGLACYSGGVFVAAGPELLYLKNTKTNGMANVREVIFNGFGVTNRWGEPALANNFNWGLDNRIHAASAAGIGLAPLSAAPGAGVVSLSVADFSFDPRELAITAEAGPAESGLSFDDWGRKFACDRRRPLRTPMYEPRYLARNPFFAPAPEMLDVASPATRISQLVPGPTNSAGSAGSQASNRLATTWLTNAHGCVIYRGNAFPAAYLGNAFVADAAAHIIHRFVVRESGLGVTAYSPTNETNTEFVASADSAFQPIQLLNGPDGALYVLDRGDSDDRGRIFRIVPSNFKRPKPPRLGKASTDGLIAMLSHPNGWNRDTAARLLYERRDAKAVLPLERVLAASQLPLARLHALYALAGMNALTPPRVLLGLRDRDPRIREHTVRLSESLLQRGPLPDDVWNQLRLMAADPSPGVRYQLAFTMGELRRTNTALVLGSLLVRDPANPWVKTAVFSSLVEGAGDLFLALTQDGRVRRDPIGQQWLVQLASLIGLRGAAVDVSQVFDLVDQLRAEPGPAFALLSALGEGLHYTRSSLALADESARMQPFYSDAVNALVNSSVSVPVRIDAIHLLGVGPYSFANGGDILLLQLGSSQPATVQSAAVTALGRFADPRLVSAVVQRWRLLTPRVRSDAITALLARDERVAAVMTAVENGDIAAAQLSSTQMNFLRTSRDASVRQSAQRLFGPVPLEQPKLMHQFWPALALKASASRGRQIFAGRCAACHQFGGAAGSVGPDLVNAKVNGKEWILRSILEPNAQIRRDYRTYAVVTAEGENLVGVMRDENAATIILQPPTGGPVVLPRDNILYLPEQPWSLMPERLDAGLTTQNMADLVEYVFTAAP